MNEILIKILRNKKTGNFHCPSCIKKCKVIKITEDQKGLYCKKCKKYYAYPESKLNQEVLF